MYYIFLQSCNESYNDVDTAHVCACIMRCECRAHACACVCMDGGLAVGHEHLELHACMDTVETGTHKQTTVIRLTSCQQIRDLENNY